MGRSIFRQFKTVFSNSLTLLFFSLFFSGCSTRSSESSFNKIRQSVGERISEQIVWREGLEELKAQLLDEIRRGGLTQENGVQLALINNPELFAFYENLEIGYAELLEAGLMQNPFFSASIGFPNKSGYSLNNFFDAAISFLDFFLIPIRKRAAEAEIKVIECQVGQKILELVHEVQINWLEVKGLDLHLAEERKLVELSELAANLAYLQYTAGNISLLQARERQLEYLEESEKLKGVEAEYEIAKERMNRSLGIFGEEADWVISGEIEWRDEPELPDLYEIEKFAIENRFDIEAVRHEIEMIAERAKLKEWWTYSNLLVGVSVEKEPEGFTTIGPSISLQVPIFNHGQGEHKKVCAMIEQTQKILLSKAVEACAKVRESFNTANQYLSQIQTLETEIFPSLQQQIVLAQAHYNVMTLSVYDLLRLKAHEVRATIDWIEAARSYKKARADLLYAAGGSLHLLRDQE